MKRAVLVLGAILIAGCSGSGTGPQDNATVQLLQADPAAPSTVAFTIDNVTVDASVSFGNSSTRISTTAGNHRLAIESLSGTVAELTGNLEAGANYYVVSAGGELFLAEGRPMDVNGTEVPPDTGQRDPVRAHIRFVNVPGEFEEPPFRVDAMVTSPATVDTTFQIGLDTRIASYGTLIYLNPGTVTVKIQPDGLPTVLAQETFPVAQGEVKALVLERDANLNLRLRVVVER
jgi:hypothetical protein